MRGLPVEPGAGKPHPLATLACRQLSSVGVDDPFAITPARRLLEPIPRFREYATDAFRNPVDLVTARRCDRDEHQFRHALGMRLRIGERKRRPPRHAGDEPAREAQVLPQGLDIGDERRPTTVSPLPDSVGMVTADIQAPSC